MVRGRSRRTTRRSKAEKEKQEAASAASSVGGSPEESGDEEEEKEEEKKPTRRSRRTRKPTTKVATATGQSKRGTTKSDKESQEEGSEKEDGSDDEKGSKDESDVESSSKNNGDSKEESKKDHIDEEDEDSSNENDSYNEAEESDKGSEVEEPSVKKAKGRRGAVAKKAGIKSGEMKPLNRVTRKRSRVQSEGEGEKKPPSLRRGKRAARASEDESQSSNMPPATKRRRTRRGKQQESEGKKKASEDETGSHREDDPGNDNDGSDEEKSGSHKDEESGDENESREASSNNEGESDKEDEVEPTSRRTRGRRKQTRSKPSAGKSKQGTKESDDNGNKAKAKATRPKRGRPKKTEEKEEQPAAENGNASDEQDDKAYDSDESGTRDEIASEGRLAKQKDEESSNENMSGSEKVAGSEDGDEGGKDSATSIKDGEDAQTDDEAPKECEDGTFTKRVGAKEEGETKKGSDVEKKESEKPTAVEDEQGVEPTEMKNEDSEKQDQVEHEDDESEKSTEVEESDGKGEKRTKIKDSAVEGDRPSVGIDKRGGPPGSKGEDRPYLKDKDVKKSAETKGKEECAELHNKSNDTKTEIEDSESKKQIRVKEKGSEKPTEVEEKGNEKPSEVREKDSAKHSEAAAKNSRKSYAVEDDGSKNPAGVDEEQCIKLTEADDKLSSGKGKVSAISEDVEGRALSKSIVGEHRTTQSFQDESNEIGSTSEKTTGEESIRKNGTEGTNLEGLPAERLTSKKRTETDLAGNDKGQNSHLKIAEGDKEESPRMEDPEDVVKADVSHEHVSSRDKDVRETVAIFDATGSRTEVETSKDVDTSGGQGETEAVQKGTLGGMPADKDVITDKSVVVAPNTRKDIGINEDAIVGLTMGATNNADDDTIGTRDAKKVGEKLKLAADVNKAETNAGVVAERPQSEPVEDLGRETIQSSKTENTFPSSVRASKPGSVKVDEKASRDPPGEVVSSTVQKGGRNEIGIKPIREQILGQRLDLHGEDADSSRTPKEETDKANEAESAEDDGPPKSTLSPKADENTLDDTEKSSQKEGTWLVEIAQSAEKTEAMKATSEPALKEDDLRKKKVGNDQIEETIDISASQQSQSGILRNGTSAQDPSKKGPFENAKNDEKEKFDANNEGATLHTSSTLGKEVVDLNLQNSEGSRQETHTLCAGLNGPDPVNKENWDSKPDHEMDEAGPSNDGNVRSDELETADTKPSGESPMPSNRSDTHSRKMLHIPNRCNLDRIKMLLFSIGGQTHKGRGFERLFSEYWGALSQIVAGSQSGPETTRLRVVIKSFLKTKRLKKLHNRLVMALIDRSLQETVPLSEVSGHIPSSIRDKVKLVNADKQTLSVKAESKLTCALEKSPENEESKSTVIFSSVPLHPYTSLYSEKAGNASEELNKLNIPSASPSLPGALVVDPFVRELVQSEGLRVSENAVWLFVVAIREYTKSMINRAILSKEARRKNQIPAKNPEHMQLIPKMNSVNKGKSPDPKQSNIVRETKGVSKLTLAHDNVISVKDLALLSSNMKISSVASERQKALKVERLAKATPAKSSGGDVSTSKVGHTAATSKPAAPMSEDKSEPPKVVQRQTVRSPVPGQGLGRGAKNLGLGRGAKDLAALKARTAAAQASGTTKPPDTVDPNKIQKQSAATAAASTLSRVQASATVNPSSSKGTEDPSSSKDSEAPPSTSVQEKRPVGNPNQVVKRGKGLGKKNLAAMRARVTGSSGGEAQADENAKENSDNPAPAAHSAEPSAASKQTPMQPQLAAVTSKAPPSTSAPVTERDPQPLVRESQEEPATLPRTDETALIPNSDETGSGGARGLVVTKIGYPPVDHRSVSSKPTDVVAAVKEPTSSREVSNAPLDEERKFLPSANASSIDTPISTAQEPAMSTMLGASDGSKCHEDRSELVTSGTTVESTKIGAPPPPGANRKADVSTKDAIQENDHRFEPKKSSKWVGSEGSIDKNATEAAITDKEDNLVSSKREGVAVAKSKVILDASDAALENENKQDASRTLNGDGESDKIPAETKALAKAEKKQDSTSPLAAAVATTSPPPSSAAIHEKKSDTDADGANPDSKEETPSGSAGDVNSSSAQPEVFNRNPQDEPTKTHEAQDKKEEKEQDESR